MAFNWKSFLVKMAVLAEPIAVGAISLTKEAKSGVPNTQLANDTLNEGTGIAEALLSDDPQEVAMAEAASQITAQVIAGIAATHPALNPPPTAPAPVSAAAGAAVAK